MSYNQRLNSMSYKGHLYSTHSQRVQGAIDLMKSYYEVQDRQARVYHDVRKIEERFNEMGLEIKSLRTFDVPSMFYVNINVVGGECNDRGARLEFEFVLETKFEDRHWPIQSSWKPYEDPLKFKDWSLMQHCIGSGVRWIAQDCTFDEVINEYHKVRNYIASVNVR